MPLENMLQFHVRFTSRDDACFDLRSIAHIPLVPNIPYRFRMVERCCQRYRPTFLNIVLGCRHERVERWQFGYLSPLTVFTLSQARDPNMRGQMQLRHAVPTRLSSRYAALEHSTNPLRFES